MPSLLAMLAHVSPEPTSQNLVQSLTIPGSSGVGVVIPLPGELVEVAVV